MVCNFVYLMVHVVAVTVFELLSKFHASVPESRTGSFNPLLYPMQSLHWEMFNPGGAGVSSAYTDKSSSSKFFFFELHKDLF